MSASTDAPRPPAPADEDGADLAGLVLALIGTRQSVAPKRLHAPGPDAEQLQRLVQAGACAPDHRGLRPWRLIRVGDGQRDALADLFEACSRDRGAAEGAPPSADDLAKSRAKAYRAPLLLLAVMRSLPADPEVPDTERAVALGAALMAMLLAAHGMGFGAMLTSGRAVRTERFARAFALQEGEQAVCFLSVGTAEAQKPKPRASAHEFLGDWVLPPPNVDANADA